MGDWSYNPTYRSYNPIYKWKGAHLVAPKNKGFQFRNLLFQGAPIFKGYVSFREGIQNGAGHDGDFHPKGYLSP